MARAVDHVDMGDVEPLALHQRRHEAVKGVEIRQREVDVAAERLEAAAGIARAVLQDPPANAVGDARLPLLVGTVLAPDPLAGDERRRRGSASRAATSSGMKAGSFWPSPSRVRRSRRDRAAATPRAHRRALAAARLVADDRSQGRVARAFISSPTRRVGRAVIHVDRPRRAQGRAGALDLLEQERERSALVLDRHDDAERGVSRIAVRIIGHRPSGHLLSVAPRSEAGRIGADVEPPAAVDIETGDAGRRAPARGRGAVFRRRKSSSNRSSTKASRQPPPVQESRGLRARVSSISRSVPVRKTRLGSRYPTVPMRGLSQPTARPPPPAEATVSATAGSAAPRPKTPTESRLAATNLGQAAFQQLRCATNSRHAKKATPATQASRTGRAANGSVPSRVQAAAARPTVSASGNEAGSGRGRLAPRAGAVRRRPRRSPSRSGWRSPDKGAARNAAAWSAPPRR